MTSHLDPALGVGTVMHARHLPLRHRFVYPMFFLRLPLSRLHEIGGALLGIDRLRPMSLRSRDHGPRNGAPLLPWIRGLLQEQGLGAVDGEVVLQTMPRLFGYAFNPVSFWFCHDRDGALRAVLCEVRNTFGEHHNYLVAHPDARPIAAADVIRARKVFHVSPFFPVRGEYSFRFGEEGGRSVVAIDYYEEARRRLSTRLAGDLRPLDGAALAHALLRFPLQTLGVTARIHWQALRLWAKRVPFFRKPEPPLQEMTR